MKRTFELEFEGRKLAVEVGELAKQADGAVLVRYGKGERERIEALIARRWWDTGKRAERSAFGPRP